LISLKSQPFRDRHLWQLFCFVEDKYSSVAHNGTEKDSTNPMLTAHRQEPQPGAASLASGTQAGEFAKVLTSIQGLQQRLDGFSFEEASQAEANVHTIIQQLLTIQAKLSQVTGLKHFVSSANWRIGEIPEENFEQVDLDGLESHPQLHAIIRASKLIRVHKLMQAAKAGAEALSLHDEVPLHLLDPDTSALSATQPGLAPTQPLIVNPQRTELQDVPPVVAEAIEKTVPEGGWVFSADAELEYTEPHFVEHAVINAREDKFTDEAISKIPKPTGGEMSVVVRETGFDERLLSDLIQAYGEFSPVLKTSSSTTQPRAAEIESGENQIPSSPMRGATAQEISSESELIREDSAKPALLMPPEEQPANSNNVTLATRFAQNAKTTIADSRSTGLALIRSDRPIFPQPQVDRAELGNQKATLPNIKKHGELDRQLKNIIKDYGEYDLYPHQSSTNLKKAALAALAALVLVLGVLYLFKAPSNGRNSAASSATQSPDTSNTNSADAAHRP
jgi:hypothetical protein